MADQRVQIQGSVRLVAVQKNGYGGNADMGQSQRYYDQTPPRKIQHPGK
jgi:hypothetical protein